MASNYISDILCFIGGMSVTIPAEDIYSDLIVFDQVNMIVADIQHTTTRYLTKIGLQ